MKCVEPRDDWRHRFLRAGGFEAIYESMLKQCAEPVPWFVHGLLWLQELVSEHHHEQAQRHKEFDPALAEVTAHTLQLYQQNCVYKTAVDAPLWGLFGSTEFHAVSSTHGAHITALALCKTVQVTCVSSDSPHTGSLRCVKT